MNFCESRKHEPSLRDKYDFVFRHLSESTKEFLRERHMQKKHDRWAVSHCVNCRIAAVKKGIHIPSYFDLVDPTLVDC